MIRLYHGNRLERLADALAALVAEPLGSPLASEIVLVQSNGMARWLSLRLAAQNRVCANVRFPYPAGFVWEVFRAFKPDLPETSRFEPEVLAWRLYELLPRLTDDPRYAELAAYLRGGDCADRFELARRLADVYDQYLVYRSDWIVRWQAGQEHHWQAALWRELCRDGESHRAQLLDEVVRLLREQAPPAGALPERIALFGIAALPQPYVALLDALARHCDVHAFLLNPSAEYWGQIRSDREIGRRAADADPQALYLETGNTLLASLGRQGRDFLELLLDYPIEHVEHFEPAAGRTLLEGLQNDILQLTNRGTDGDRTPLAPDDRSLQIHSCHSRMREVEVLHDQLLQLFADDAALSPADVVVMTPDIEAYAPYVDAVFAAAEHRIPYAIADRSARREQPVLECLLKLLELRDGRFEADRVCELLDVPALRARFGIEEAELPRLHDWLRRTGVRWGVDAEHRARLGLPAAADHSWRAGLDRMLLGYAMPARERRLFAGILPFDDVEGSGGELAGRLLAFADAAFGLPDELARDRSAGHWRELLNALLERFFLPGPADDEALAGVRRALDDLARSAELAGLAEPVPLEVVIGCLRRRLEAAPRVGSFLGGGVTFCAMVPMRSIPFRVVCLLGMNDGEFPRQQRPPGFDLMARQPRPGDRSRRFEDRYLFLEALLSARGCLYLSYVGQSIRDNGALPPSVIVDELLDYVAQGWETADGADIRDRLITRHRLQAFSPAYFDGRSERLFSYAHDLCDAGAQAGRGRRQRRPLLTAPLPAPDAGWRSVELPRLIEFWRCPAEFLLKHRLGIVLGERSHVLEGREPFVLNGLELWQLGQDLLELSLAGQPEAPEAYARAAGRLPHGVVGEQVLAAQVERVRSFAEKLSALPAADADPRPFVLEIDAFRLTGALDRLSAAGRTDCRLGKERGKDLLGIWITHLALNAAAPAGVAPMSHWLSEEGGRIFRPVADAREQLASLLRWYWQGLCEPLPFAAEASLAWAGQARRGGDGEAAARKVWRGNDHQPGEAAGPYLALAFADGEPMADPRFAELAEAVWLPLLAAAEERP